MLNKKLTRFPQSLSFETKGSASRVLREQIDRQKLEYIVNHSDEFDLSSRTTRAKKLDKEGQLTLLKDYLDRTNVHGEQIMEYYQRNNFGRYWVSENLGLQNMKRKIRHAVCKDLMYDIDMKNDHPTLLSWYCHENGIKNDSLKLSSKVGNENFRLPSILCMQVSLHGGWSKISLIQAVTLWLPW